MGTYLRYWGDMSIPEHKRKEFTQRVLYLLHQGGMFQTNTIFLFDKEIEVLSPVTVDENGVACFNFNYFEDDSWESAGYNVNKAAFFSNKVGGNEFNGVLRSVYILYEFYTESFGLALEDGVPFDATPYIQWLNYLFQESYTNARRLGIRKPYQMPIEPLPPMTTETFLMKNHRGSANVFEDENVYRITNDDRAYYWQEHNDIEFSKDMNDWLQKLRQEWEQFRNEGSLMIPSQAQNLWFDTLYEANRIYRNLYCFAVTFYEFLEQSHVPEIQAAMILLQRLVECNRPEQIPEQDPLVWLKRLIQLDHPGRIEIKRYLAVLGNSVLRKDVFGF